jgi:malate dehydrogenase
MASKYPYGPPRHKVALLGASGGIGQPLSLLLKLNPLIAELAFYDIKQAATPVVGVAADVSHINTGATVKGYAGDEEIAACLTGCSTVLITAGVPRKPGMTRDDLFKINAKIVKGLAEACAKHCPKAMILVITNPVNSTVPIVSEVFKKAGVYDSKRIVGVTTLDVLRARTFVAENNGADPKITDVPVVGGHAGETIVALLSQAQPPLDAKTSQYDIEALDKHVQDAGTEVVDAKGGAGSATLSMAYAAAKFCEAILLGLSGVKQIECAYVNVSEYKLEGVDTEYFAGKVEFGPSGVAGVHPIPANITAYEKKRLSQALVKLKGDIKTGIDFAKSN